MKPELLTEFDLTGGAGRARLLAGPYADQVVAMLEKRETQHFTRDFGFEKSYETDFVEYVKVPVALKDGLARKALSSNPAVNVLQQEGAFKTKQSVQMIDFEVRVAVQEWYVSPCVQKERTANICKSRECFVIFSFKTIAL